MGRMTPHSHQSWWVMGLQFNQKNGHDQKLFACLPEGNQPRGKGHLCSQHVPTSRSHPGWWCNNHLEKHESMGRMTSHIWWTVQFMFDTSMWSPPCEIHGLIFWGPTSHDGWWDSNSTKKMAMFNSFLRVYQRVINHGEKDIYVPNMSQLREAILVGGAITILKNMSQWEGWHPIYDGQYKSCLTPVCEAHHGKSMG